MKRFNCNFLKSLLLIGLLLFINTATFAQQCPAVTLINGGGANTCLPAVFTANTTSSISQIQWMQGNTVVNTAKASYLSSRTIVAGSSAGIAADKLNYPINAIVADDGALYIPDQLNNRVQKWLPGATSGITVAGGNLKGNKANQLDGPVSVAVDAGGNVYVADVNNSRVQKWAPGATSGITVASGIYPRSIALNAAGDLLIFDIVAHKITKWAAGATSGTVIINTPPQALDGMYVDKNGDIYIVYASQISKYSASSNYGTPDRFGTVPSSGAGICGDGQGNIYTIGPLPGQTQFRVTRCSMATQYAYDEVLPPTTYEAFSTATTTPNGIALDAAGNMYITYGRGSYITKYAPVITKTYTATAAATYSAIVSTFDGCTTTSNQVVTTTVPDYAGAVKGPSNVCPNTTQTYAVTRLPGVQSFIWELPAGWKGTSTTESITVTAGSTGGTIYAMPVNACGRANSASALKVTTGPPAAPSGISGPATVITGNTYTYTTTAVPGATRYNWTLPDNSSVVSPVNAITVTGAVSGNVTVTASNDCGTSAPKSLAVTATPGQSQAITLPSFANVSFGGDDITLPATTDANLPLTYTSSNTDVAVIEESAVTTNALKTQSFARLTTQSVPTQYVLHIVGAGTAVIKAIQAGDDVYAAKTVSQTLTVKQASQMVTFNALKTITTQQPDFDPGATASSGLPITYTLSNARVATVVNNKLHIIAAGTVTVIAKQVGNTNYTAATASQTLTVTAPLAQTITFPAIAAQGYGGADFDPGATSTSNLPVQYSSSDNNIAQIVNNKVHIVAMGSVIITAGQPGDATYAKANVVNRALTIGKGTQTITFMPFGTVEYGKGDITPNAYASSGLDVIFTSADTSIAKIIAGKIHIVKIGTVNISALQSGNSMYNAAAPAVQQLTVSKAAQTLSFNSIPTMPYGTPDFDAGATSTSGLKPTYISGDTTVATIVNGLVHITGQGTTIITALQNGDANFAPAAPFAQMLTVVKGSQTITFPTTATVIFTPVDFAPGATVNSGLPIVYTSSDTTRAKIIKSKIHLVRIGSVKITATRSGDAHYTAAASIVQQLTISKANQTITFPALAVKKYGDAAFSTLSSSTSGLALNYLSSDTSVATISKGMVTVRKLGTTTITISQAGNTNFYAATPVSQTLNVVKGDQLITFKPFAAKTYGSAGPFSTGAASSSRLALTYTFSDTTVAVMLNGKITIKGAGQTTITANQAGNNFYNAAPPVSQLLTVAKAAQTITFAAIPAKLMGAADFKPGATASSKLAVTYASSNPAVATIVNGLVHIAGAGTAIITAKQAGSANYLAADSVNQTLSVTKASQTITFAAIGTKNYLDADFALTAGSTSGLPVSFTIADTTVAKFVAGKVHIIKPGTTNITAVQAGNVNYNPANNVIQVFTAGKANQTITFAALPAKAFGDADFTLSAVSSSGLPVNLSTRDTTIIKINNSVVHILRALNATVTATQAGNAYYNAATVVNQPLVIGKGNQTINFANFAAKKYGDAPFATGASASSGLTVAYASSDTLTAKVSNGSIYIFKPGTVTITALQVGNTNYNAAAAVSRVLTIGKSEQSITFAALPGKTFGDTNFALAATSNSGLSVSYTSSDTTIAVIVNTSVAIKAGGQVTITASQAGNSFYNAAPPVSQVLTVAKAAQTITFAAIPGKTFGGADFNAGASASSKLAITYSSSNPAVATIVNGLVHITGAGTATITGSQPGSTQYAAAANVAQTLTVNKASQAITFASIANTIYGAADISPVATASSNLAVTDFASSNTAIATIVNGKIHIVGSGGVIITATQAGNANFNAATPVNVSISVARAPLTITADNKTRVSGADNPVFTATYTGLVNGDTPAILTKQPVISASTTAVVGTYPINIGGATAINYSITFVAGVLTVTPKPAAGFTQPGNQVLAVADGRSGTDVKGEPVVRSAVSPNGDGINDVLTIDGLAAYPDNSLTVVNTGGNSIYQVKGYDNVSKVFDGHSNITGAMQKPGTYYYLLQYNDNGQLKRKTGYLLIKY